MIKTKLTVADILLSVLIIVLAMLLWLLPHLRENENQYVTVTTADGAVSYYRLEGDREITLISNAHELLVRIEGGEVFVVRSTCEDQICKASGRVARSGEVIVCAPAGVSIRIEGGNDDVDFVAG